MKRLLSVSRLVTLTGAGGVGKTRLAGRTATTLERVFSDGVWMVELANLDKPELLTTTVMEALKIRDWSGRPPLDVLTEHLRDKHLLVVLDNCEHLHNECAFLAENLLRSAPRVRILATSRQVLGIAGEQTLPVPPLPLDHRTSPGNAPTARSTEAVQLFADRARAVLPEFAVTEANQEAVEQICRRLDGLPLAIEMAAARLRGLSVEQVLERLDDRFRLLTRGSRAVLPRHQTLQALMDWSHQLCGRRERAVWARMSVFSGGCDLEAVEEVCSGDGVERSDVVDVVAALVEKSIVSREEQAGRVRYRLLETIRQYGRERLAESGREAEVRRRHRDYYRKLAAEADAKLFGPDQVAWLSKLQVEHSNLRTALEHYLSDRSDGHAALDMVADLLYHWITSYFLTEGRHWTDRALDRAFATGEPRARALWCNSWLAIIQGDLDTAAAMLAESKAIGERLGLEHTLGYVAVFSGMVAMARHDVKTAIALYQEGIDRHTFAGDPVGHVLALVRLSLARSYLGQTAAAVSLGEEGLAICDVHGETWHRSYTMMALGVERWLEGDTARAIAMEQDSLRANRSLEDPFGMGLNLEVLAWVAASEGRHARAAGFLGIAQALWKALGAPLSGYGHLVRYHDACEDEVRRALGPSRFLKEFQRGLETPIQVGVARALGEPTAAGTEGSDPDTSSPLTPRETQIAGLVAEGESNKEIAAALVISTRTVEGHVEHIMNKLGFNSRVQIASWVWEQGRGDEAGPAR
ncbi:LuxR C-terminal-related transcriptional regulator [Spirillospora sp. CA-108201]